MAQSAGALAEPDTYKHQWGGTLGGPIVEDKVHFFFSYERYVLGTGLTNVFPPRPDMNLTIAPGLNGNNYMGRLDHQINNNNTFTVRYLTERQPNRNLYTGDRATATTGNYELDIDQTASVVLQSCLRQHGAEHPPVPWRSEQIHRGAEPGDFLENNDKELELPC